MPTEPSTPTRSFLEDYHSCLDHLRASLADLLAASGLLHARPQEMAREFSLNKNLTWKISKLVHQNPSSETLSFIPGPSGFRIFLRALANYGVEPSLLEHSEKAFSDFQSMVRRHAGDRPTMQLLLDSVAADDGDHARLEESRRLAYQGNSGILGIQARVRLSTFFVAPNRENPSMLDSAFLGGLFGLRRFRPDARWILSRNTGFADDGSEVQSPRCLPLDPRSSQVGPSLLLDFTSSPVPEVSIRRFEDMDLYELAQGPIGNTGVADVCFGHFTRADLPRYRDAHNQNGEFHILLASPVETLIFDMVLHKDLGVDTIPQALMPLNFHQALMPASSRMGADYLPLPEKPRLLHGTQPTFATPRIERYTEMTELVFHRLGWDPHDFRAWRLEMQFPPLPATLIMSFPLQAPQ